MADVLWFKPQDDLRLGYRIWSDQATGLVMKLQTLAVDGRVVEQAAFSEIDWNAPVRAEDLSRSMDAIAGFQVVSVDVRKPLHSLRDGAAPAGRGICACAVLSPHFGDSGRYAKCFAVLIL